MTHPLPISPVTFRPAQPADALVLGVLATQVFLDTYATAGIRETVAREVLNTFSTAALQQALADPAVHIDMAEVQGHAVGFAHTVRGAAQALVTAHAATPPTAHQTLPTSGAVQAELLRLYVQEPFTRQGIGKTLLHAAEAAARRQGAHVLWLTPWVHNHRALRFYAAQGYRDLGSTLFRFEGEAHENRVMAKLLAKPLANPLAAP